MKESNTTKTKQNKKQESRENTRGKKIKQNTNIITSTVSRSLFPSPSLSFASYSFVIFYIFAKASTISFYRRLTVHIQQRN